MQFRNSLLSLNSGGGTSGTANIPRRSLGIINYGRDGADTITFHLQKAVVIQLQLYQ
jgi:hypothetical protein